MWRCRPWQLARGGGGASRLQTAESADSRGYIAATASSQPLHAEAQSCSSQQPATPRRGPELQQPLREGSAKMWNFVATCLLAVCCFSSCARGQEGQEGPTPCTCGVFLSGDFARGQPPRGSPALVHEHPDPAPCSPLGTKLCTNRCLELIVKHLPNSPMIVCGTVDRDCFKERAYLFVKNCNDSWVNSYLSAGREFCCKDGEPYKCPAGPLRLP
ncbi:uncharacterized protein LOC134532187 [Bacillus rossius redtenbacheri]|uniref:uncharacterized protein LOC134532187 n=1 Tax=Bacillus rossius redtenbacheri TaxID=93214 RepID=UPI002FDEC0B4